MRLKRVDILYLLVPLSVIAMLAVLALFAWALRGGQLDNLSSEGERILWTDSLTHNDSDSDKDSDRGNDNRPVAARRPIIPTDHPENPR